MINQIIILIAFAAAGFLVPYSLCSFWDWFKSQIQKAYNNSDLKKQLDKIMDTQAQAADKIRGLTQTINKIGTETTATLNKVTALQEIIDAGNGGEISEELQKAINEAITSAKATDDLVPDAPVTPAEPPPESPAPGE